MVICKRPLILATDLAALLALGALGGVVGVLCILPGVNDRTAFPELRRELIATHEHEHSLSQRNRTLSQAIEQTEAALRSQAAQPLTDAGTFLEHLSEQCSLCGVSLLLVNPQATVIRDEYSSWDVQVQARGSFPDFQRLLSRIESWSPFVQTETIRIAAAGPAGRAAEPAACELHWTVRINYLPAWAGTGAQP